jgi:ribulose-phosphate 3-epimerase
MKKVALAIHAVKNFNLEILNSLENLDYIHVDVMDGKFVNNAMLYLDIFKEIKKISHLPVIAHLMVENPNEYILKLINLVDIFLFHYEIDHDIVEIIDLVKSNNKKVGLVLNPETSIDNLEPFFKKIDLILIMGVHPGWSGQKFLQETVSKLKELIKKKKNFSFEIDIDDGVNLQNAKDLKEADILSSSSTILKAKNPNKVILQLKGITNND